jgi:hypothetical protein
MAFAGSGGAANVTSAQIVDGEIVNADINSGAAIDPSKIAGEPYEVLADVTLGVAGTALSSGTIPARTFLRLLISVPSLESTGRINIEFNGSGGTDYDFNISANYAAATASTGQALIYLDLNNSTGYRWAVVDIYNPAAASKHTVSHCAQNNLRDNGSGRWNVTSGAITSIVLGAGGNMVAGTRMKVLGMN